MHSSSLTFPDFSQKWITGFKHFHNSVSFKEIWGENLHNFKEILLVMYVYHKVVFTFELSFSTPTYDARWMWFNFIHSLMNTVESIDLHNSLQAFSIRILLKLRTFKGILVLKTTRDKKNVVHFQRRHYSEEQCSTKEKHNIRSILIIKILWTHISLQYWKQFIQTKATVTEIAICFDRPQRGNEYRHGQIPTIHR